MFNDSHDQCYYDSIPNRFNVGALFALLVRCCNASGLYGNDAGPIWNAIWVLGLKLSQLIRPDARGRCNEEMITLFGVHSMFHIYSMAGYFTCLSEDTEYKALYAGV